MLPQLAQIASLLAAETPAEGAQGCLRTDALLPVVMFAILYLVWIRPATKERKTHEQMLGGLKRGDEIVTTSGILGTIADMTDVVITLEVAKNVKIRVLKSSISKRVEEAKAKEEKAAVKDDKPSEAAPKAPKT